MINPSIAINPIITSRTLIRYFLICLFCIIFLQIVGSLGSLFLILPIHINYFFLNFKMIASYVSHFPNSLPYSMPSAYSSNPRRSRNSCSIRLLIPIVCFFFMAGSITNSITNIVIYCNIL